MKLIAETDYENQIVHSLCSLIRDLKVDVDGYLHEQAVATTFWSADDFFMHHESIRNASQQIGKHSFFQLKTKFVLL